MKFAGLTGGIGCGKSTVAAGLAARGAVCIDVDQISRQLQQPGEPVFVAMFERWGERILQPDGTLDRRAVAAITFGDDEEMAALMDLTSTAIEAVQLERIRPLEDTDAVVLLEAALLGPGIYGTRGLLVVDAPVDVAVDRLVRHRGMDEADVRARMARQRSREERLAIADLVVDNSRDDPAALEAQLDAAWAWLQGLPDARYEPRVPSSAGVQKPGSGAAVKPPLA